ncbi:dihydrofolate reductase family protein [Actinomadura parmotrematis]|uniref:Dihydrofolate reductase family protein n=1 Tax=Actinomadura parmotrematis TaxID=2864039 RepID=A0ABS7FS92_9ACTN|nr:dihydrofolate reductase family protein [Actinomadura parmotrematis]MBW8482393.1 dihydrofolate reductase family protein [Actinomadura parmotrematis]
MDRFPADPAALRDLYAYPDSPGPWVRANMVASVDGAAQSEGVSAGLANDDDHTLFHVLRGLADVILVGARTVRVEGYGPARDKGVPIAVVSRSLDLDLASPLFTEATAPTLVFTSAAAPADRVAAVRERAEVLVAGDDLVDLGACVRLLGERGHRRVLTEGGPAVLAQIAAAGVLDELCLTVSPQLTAGDATRILNAPALPAAVRLRLAGALEADDFLFLRYLVTR